MVVLYKRYGEFFISVGSRLIVEIPKERPQCNGKKGAPVK